MSDNLLGHKQISQNLFLETDQHFVDSVHTWSQSLQKGMGKNGLTVFPYYLRTEPKNGEIGNPMLYGI